MALSTMASSRSPGGNRETKLERRTSVESRVLGSESALAMLERRSSPPLSSPQRRSYIPFLSGTESPLHTYPANSEKASFKARTALLKCSMVPPVSVFLRYCEYPLE